MLTMKITFVGGVEKNFYHVDKDTIHHDDGGVMSFVYEAVGIDKRLFCKDDLRKAFIVKSNVCCIESYPEDED